MKMNLERFLCAGASVLLLSTAIVRAQNNGPYFKADLGGAVTEDVKLNQFLGLNIPGAKLRLDPGLRAGIGGGFQFCDFFSLEGELGFMANEIKGVSDTFSHVHDATLANVPFLVNAKLQYPFHNIPLTIYGGAGAGFSESIFDVDHLSISDNFGNTVSIHGSDADAVFAWQAFAGLRFALNERMGLGVEYRYFEADSPSWHADFTFNTSSDKFGLGHIHTHAISAVFDYHF